MFHFSKNPLLMLIASIGVCCFVLTSQAFCASSNEPVAFYSKIDGNVLSYKIEDKIYRPLELILGRYRSNGQMIGVDFLEAWTQRGAIIKPADSYKLFLVDKDTFVPVPTVDIDFGNAVKTYSAVLEQYRHYLRDGLYIELTDTYPVSKAGRYINTEPWPMHISSGTPPAICYAYEDLNSDGVDELIMGMGSNSDYYPNKALVLDVFTDSGSGIVNVFDGTPSTYGFYERNTLTIYKNGKLRNWKSGGAGVDYYYTYLYPSDSSSSYLTEILTSDWWTDQTAHKMVFSYTITHSNGEEKEISTDDFKRAVERYNTDPVLQLEWHPLV